MELPSAIATIIVYFLSTYQSIAVAVSLHEYLCEYKSFVSPFRLCRSFLHTSVTRDPAGHTAAIVIGDLAWACSIRENKLLNILLGNLD